MNLKDFTEKFSGSPLEDQIFTEDQILPEGLFLELYGNMDGVTDIESNEGQSMFIRVAEPTTFGELLKLFSYLGTVRDGTLTIRIVEPFEKEELNMCDENPLR